MKKRIMALLLSLVMALSLVPTTVWAAGASTEVADDGISVQALNTGHKIDVTFTVLYVGDEFRIGYNYGASEKTQFVCQYATNHSDTAYNNHTIAISDIKAAADRASVNSGYQIVGWSKESNANPTIWRLNMSGTTACNKGTTIYLVAKNPNPELTYTLNFDANGGTGAPGSLTGKSSTGSYTFQIPGTVPTKDGYDFLGWSEVKDGAVVCKENGSYTATAISTTLYAVWKEKTPPVTEPADPKLGENFDFSKKIVDVICETTNDHNASYGLMNGYYTVSEKKPLVNGKWQCKITIDLTKYFELYNSQHPGLTHTKEQGTTEIMTIYPTWYENSGNWIFVGTNTEPAKIFVKCDATQPEGPGEGPTTGTSIAGAVTVKCVTPNETTPNHSAKTYALTAYTASSVEGDGAGNYYCTLTLTNVDAFVTQYNTDTSAVHTKKNANETYKVRVKYVPKTDTVPAHWVLDGDPAVIKVENCTNSNIPNEPTFDEIFKALNGLVTVTCINRVWKDGNKVMDCGESKYAAKAGIVGQNYTIKQDKNNANAWIVTFPVTNFVKAFKQTPAHDLYSNNTLNWSITWTDKKWTAKPVEQGVDDLVKLTHAPTDWREVNKVTHNGIWTSCENGKTGKCEYGIAVAFAKGDVVSVVPEAGVPGSYIATFKVSTYADTCAKACNDKNFKNSSRTHDLLTKETVQWRLYATKQADEEIGNQVLNHVWAAEPVTKGTDDVCQVAHRVKVTFDENYNNASTTEVMYKYNTNEVKEGRFPTNPTREGYTFKGWNTMADGTGTAFDANTKVADDMTVYAQWEATQYTITYDLRDDKASNNPANPVTYTVEDAVTLQAPTTKRNNQFLEWRDEKGNVITEIAAGTTGNVRVYAYWKCPIKLYEITNNGNVQLGNTIYVTEGTSYPLPDGSTYAKNGYTFKCWYETEGDLRIDKNRYDKAVTPTVTKEWKLYGKNIPIEYTITYVLNDKDAEHTNQTTYTVEDEFAITDATNGSFGRKFLEWRAADSKTGEAVNKIEKGTTGSITLYAIWQNPVNYFQVDKDGNKTLIRTDYVTVHEDYQTIAAIDKAGYTFDGWYKSTKDFGADSKKVTGFTATNSKAEWKLYGKLTPNEYTVTFDANADGDKSAKVTPKMKPVTFDAAYGELAKASRAGYTFQGWFTAKEGGTEVKSDDIVKTAGNHTLYAHWEITPHNVYAYLRTGDSIGDVIRLEKSTLDRLGLSEYNKNGFIPVGKFVSNTVLAEDEYYGADEDEAFLNVIKELKANIKLGAVGEKINWSWLYTPADVDDRIDGYLANDKEGYQLSGTLTLYSVMFKTEDSQNVKGMPKATYGTFYDYYIEGETITMPANPTRTGYDFKGWAVNGKTVDTTNGYTITGDVVFTAQWEKQTYTVKFDSKGGSKIDDQKVKYQETATKPTDPTKSGYTFGGWYTDNKCTKGNEFSFDTKITGNMTLYAKWDVKRTGTNPDAKNPYIKDNTTKTDGKKVESGKTFDAGIAMYVGLSILSVTGSAVVIRKRKDF